jgi:hypothetical protein
MNHRPFEDWLLNGEPLSPVQSSELHTHLAGCEYCSSLAEVNAALRTVQVVAPAAGFSDRFETRLQGQRARQRRRAWWGLFFLGLASAGVILAAAIRWLPGVELPRLGGLIAYLPALVALFDTARAASSILSVFLHIAAGFVPGYAWALGAVLFGLLGWLWVVSISRFAEAPQAQAAAPTKGVRFHEDP